MEIKLASDLLTQLKLTILMDNYAAEVKGFRVSNMSSAHHINRHKHSSYEYHIIKSGTCRVIVDWGSFEVGPGEFYLTAPGVYHEQIPLSSGGYTEYCLDVEIKELESCESETGELVKILTETECRPFKDTQNVIKLFEQALQEAFYRNIGFYGSIKNIVYLILIRSARAMGSSQEEERKVEHLYKDNDFRLIQIERFIEDNIAVNITADDVARYMCLSNKQTGRIIKEKTGIGTKELIHRLKLEKAKVLLEDTEFSLKNISLMLGFENEIYFNQFFKRKAGITPGSYREAIRKALSAPVK